jgi:acyl carrier protein
MEQVADTIETRVKKCIIERLNLQVDASDIDDDAPIFVGPEGETDQKSLGLDSIDALEMVVALGNEFNVSITDKNMDIFKSVRTISDFVRENQSS